MKKLILTSTALLAFAAASHAQFQTGVQQYQEQIRNGENQTGTIRQQQGNSTNYGNYAITIQGGGGTQGVNNADINQNDGAQGNRAGISQMGNGGNSAATANRATINQNGGPEGLSGGGVSSSATIGAAAQDGNFAGIAQMGNTNTATINQNNNSRRNGAEVYQNGSVLTATVNQNNGAINNDAFIFQGYSGQNSVGTAITNATATINQGRVAAGDINGSGQSAAESVSSIAAIIQNASFTTASINQGTRGVGGGATQNGRADASIATIEQRAGSTNSTATIEQGVFQGESFGSRATLVQTGTQNLGRIGQGGFSFDDLGGGGTGRVGGSDQGSIATLTQNGSGNAGAQNQAFISQASSGGTTLENSATITQTAGVQNGAARIAQGAGVGSFSSNDLAQITQASKATTAAAPGTGATGALIIQGATAAGGTGAASSRLNIANIDQQTGVTDGFAYIGQGRTVSAANITASRNIGTITQVTGTNLRATIQQGTDTFRDATGGVITPGSAGTTDLTGTAIVLGNISTNNVGTITQNGGTTNTAQLIQNGRYNTGIINQVGAGTSNNSASIIQTANSDRAQAIINQTAGSNNVARIIQLAGSDTDQSGYGNQAIIDQRLGSNNLAEIQQGAALGTTVGSNATSSNDNFFSLIQNGGNNQVRFQQVGYGNSATIVQNGNGNVVGAEGGVPGSIAQQVGYGNRVQLTQNGTSGSTLYFGVTQIGNNLTAIRTQNAN